MEKLIESLTNDMNQPKKKSAPKYHIGCSGSGWGVWEISTGNKVAGGFGGRTAGRIKALEKWYELEGWEKPKNWY